MTRRSSNSGNMMKQLLTIAAVLGLLILWVLGINRTAALRVSNIAILVDEQKGEKNLISVADVERLIKEDLPNDITFQAIADIDLTLIESMLNADTRILNAEVFVDARQQLVIDIIQRRPILRVMNQNGDQYYVDQSGSYVRTVNKKATRVPVITGYIEGLEPHGHVAFAPRLEKAFKVISEGRKDPMIKALIEQIHVEKNGRLVIIPKIGDQHIVLDHTEGLTQKLKNLKVFYRELAKTDGWSRKDEIDISYNDQVVFRNSENP